MSAHYVSWKLYANVEDNYAENIFDTNDGFVDIAYVELCRPSS
jgi:hypothetical protein